MSNVIELPNAFKETKCDESIVATLERLLSLAKAGHLVQLGAVGFLATNEIITVIPSLEKPFQMLGAISNLHQKYAREIE